MWLSPGCDFSGINIPQESLSGSPHYSLPVPDNQLKRQCISEFCTPGKDSVLWSLLLRRESGSLLHKSRWSAAPNWIASTKVQFGVWKQLQEEGSKLWPSPHCIWKWCDFDPVHLGQLLIVHQRALQRRNETLKDITHLYSHLPHRSKVLIMVTS